MLVDPQNFIYTKVNIKSNRVNWKCLEFRRQGCKATARTGTGDDDKTHIYSVAEHNHVSNIAKLDFLMAEKTAIDRARDNVALPPRVILGEVSNQLARQGHTLPKSGNALIQTLQRARVKAGGHPAVPKNFDDVVEMLPVEHKLTATGDRFLQFAGKVSTDDGPTMLMFMSPFGRELLKNSPHYFADGTFRTCPDPFGQVYIVYGETRQHKVLPACYGLLPNKQTETYNVFWSKLKECLDSDGVPTTPSNLIIDFEKAAMNGFSRSFKETAVSGCYFHMRKNLHSKLGEKGALVDYNENRNFQKLTGLMYSLAFVPIHEIVPLWGQIVEPEMYKMQDEITEEMDDYLDYFNDTFIGKVLRNGRRGNPRFQYTLWNKHQDILDGVPITNNKVEAWNGA